MPTYSRHPLSRLEGSGIPYIRLAQTPFNSGTPSQSDPGYLVHQVPAGVQDTIYLSVAPAADSTSTADTRVYISGASYDPFLPGGGEARVYNQYNSGASSRQALIGGELTLNAGDAVYVHNRWAFGVNATVNIFGYVNRITP